MALEKRFNPLVKAIFDLPIPVVAAVNGPLRPAPAARWRWQPTSSSPPAHGPISSRRSSNIGLIPDAGATWLLPRLAGRARAIEMLMLGERIPARQALDWGLIARVVDDEGPGRSEAVALATRLAQGPTIALGLIRQRCANSAHQSLSDALAMERAGQTRRGTDFKSAVLAFCRSARPNSTDAERRCRSNSGSPISSSASCSR